MDGKPMDKPEALNIRLSSLLMWVLPPVLGMAVFGIAPTWLVSGWPGVAAEMTAVVLVLAVMIASGSLSVKAARSGVNAAVTVFLGCSLFRMVLCPSLVAAAWWITDLPFKTMGVWMIIAYLACLALEAAWIVQALKKRQQEEKKS